MHRPTRDPDASQISHQMNVASSRPSARRLPSGGWGRLRAPQIDPLEVYGLPSKGETRLNDPKTQETYYRKIVDRYMKFCAASGSGDKLEAAFKSMSLDATPQPLQPPPPPPPPASTPTPLPQIPSDSSTTATPAQRTELALLLSAMRKLREALTATARADLFAQRAYLFVLRACLLMRSWEGYVPCLTALLRRVQAVTPLPATELRDVVGYLVLDLACRRGEVGEAVGVRWEWCGDGRGRVGRDRDVDGVLRALVRDDWLLWRRVEGRIDGYGRALMGFAEDRVRLQTLKVVGRAYLKVEREVLEAWTGRSWEELVREGVGWELEGGSSGAGGGGTDWITVRRIKGKTS